MHGGGGGGGGGHGGGGHGGSSGHHGGGGHHSSNGHHGGGGHGLDSTLGAMFIKLDSTFPGNLIINTLGARWLNKKLDKLEGPR